MNRKPLFAYVGAAAFGALFAAACSDSGNDGDIDASTDADAGADADTDADADSGAGGWEWGSCPLYYDNPWDKLAECAEIPVPMRWEEQEGPAMDIFVQRLRGTAPVVRGQLWLLQGGPGGSGADFDGLMEAFGEAYPEWDLYTLDHRGVGRSARLGCPEQETEESEEGLAITEAEWPACLAALESEWGADLAEFTTTAAARDLGHLIDETREPGKDVFVYGGSYGTTWAHRYLQLFPDQATGVILDSLAIHIFFTDYDLFFNQVGEDFIEYCAADDTCVSKLGADPWAAIGAAFDALDGGHCAEAGLDRPALRQLLGTLLMSWWTRPFIPAVVYRLQRCEAPDVAALARAIGVLFGEAPDYHDELFSSALNAHIGLSDFWPDTPPSADALQEIVDGAFTSLDAAPYFAVLYEDWPRYGHDEYWAGWAEAPIPILSMNGDLDPQTPIWVATPAVDGLAAENHYFVTAPRSPHGVIVQTPTTTTGSFLDNCGLEILVEFLDNPSVEPDTSCLSDVLPIDFEGNIAYTGYLFGTSDMWENGAKAGPSAIAPARPPGLDEAIRFSRRHGLL